MSTPPAIHERFEDGIWNDPVFVVGGGPSLRGFDWGQLKGRRVISVNRAFEKVPWADIHFSMDARFLREYWTHLDDLDGVKVFLDGAPVEYPPLRDLYTIRCLGERVLSERLSWGLGTGANSGYCAMNLALLLGGNPVVLLGFDLHPTTNGTAQWWHKGYGWSVSGAAYSRYRDNFEWAATQSLTQRRVYNASMTSAIKGFPFLSNINNIPEKRRTSRGIVIVGYYTDDYYRVEGARLVASSAMFGLPIRFEQREDLGSWVQNCGQKPSFLRHIIDCVQGRDILYVDADAVIRSDPRPYLERLPTSVDVAAHWLRTNELLSGTIFLRNNQSSRQFLESWVQRSKAAPAEWDQSTMKDVWLRHPAERTHRLPPEFTFIYDISRKMYPDVKPVIEHFQASRRTKLVEKLERKRNG